MCTTDSRSLSQLSFLVPLLAEAATPSSSFYHSVTQPRDLRKQFYPDSSSASTYTQDADWLRLDLGHERYIQPKDAFNCQPVPLTVTARWIIIVKTRLQPYRMIGAISPSVDRL
ncbi:hypothetical protein BDW22DRAFT_858540 [Trametopsis cervina]|nr:hypothetical protein BDW22DRAFT_858540 [Trametopsis cervina]